MFNPQALGTGRDVAVFVGSKAGFAMQAAVPSEVARKTNKNPLNHCDLAGLSS